MTKKRGKERRKPKKVWKKKDLKCGMAINIFYIGWSTIPPRLAPNWSALCHYHTQPYAIPTPVPIGMEIKKKYLGRNALHDPWTAHLHLELLLLLFPEQTYYLPFLCYSRTCTAGFAAAAAAAEDGSQDKKGLTWTHLGSHALKDVTQTRNPDWANLMQ